MHARRLSRFTLAQDPHICAHPRVRTWPRLQRTRSTTTSNDAVQPARSRAHYTFVLVYIAHHARFQAFSYPQHPATNNELRTMYIPYTCRRFTVGTQSTMYHSNALQLLAPKMCLDTFWIYPKCSRCVRDISKHPIWIAKRYISELELRAGYI